MDLGFVIIANTTVISIIIPITIVIVDFACINRIVFQFVFSFQRYFQEQA